MAIPLGDCRLVFVAPAEGETAVGDYSEDLISAVRPHFGEVVERRTAGPGGDGVRDILRHRRAVAELVEHGPPGRVLVHAELAAGGVSAFWSTAGLPGVPVTATIHDPPQGIWWPARTKWMANHRVAFHALHYPLRPVSRTLEGAVNGRRTVFALTETGRRSIEETYPRSNPVYIPHIVRHRPPIRPAQDRPNAVGFFGLVYRGKGFEHIARIRAHLPDDIVMRVAGRGTEALPRIDGIDILGAVDGPAEDAFFESVRAIVAPYGKRHFYAETYPASGAVSHAIAYRTPVICTSYGSLSELTADHGAVTIPITDAQPDVVATCLASAISSLVNDREWLTQLGRNADRAAEERSGLRTAEAFTQVWAQMFSAQCEGV